MKQKYKPVRFKPETVMELNILKYQLGEKSLDSLVKRMLKKKELKMI